MICHAGRSFVRCHETERSEMAQQLAAKTSELQQERNLIANLQQQLHTAAAVAAVTVTDDAAVCFSVRDARVLSSSAQNSRDAASSTSTAAARQQQQQYQHLARTHT